MNKAAAVALRSALISDPVCGVRIKSFAEDVMVARCLARRGVLPQDTAKEDGLLRFHPFLLDLYFENDGHTQGPPGMVPYLDPPSKGFSCCAADSVAFHDVLP